MLTLYILAGCVGLAALVFIVGAVASAIRAPRLPELSSLQAQPLPRTFARALTPRPLPAPAAMISLSPLPAAHTLEHVNDRSAPRTVIPLPAIHGIAPATRAKSSPIAAHVATPAHFDDAPIAARPAPYAPVAAHAPITTHANPPFATRPAPHAPIAAHASPSIATPPQASYALPLPAPMQTPMPASKRVAVALPSVVEPPRLPARMPRATIPPPIVTKTRVSWNEDEWTRSGIAIARGTQSTPVVRTHESTQRAQGNDSTQRIVRPAGRPAARLETRPEAGLLRTVIGWSITIALLVASPAVVAPSLLDPLCDYAWYGADAMVIARDCARDANIAIDVDVATGAR